MFQKLPNAFLCVAMFIAVPFLVAADDPAPQKDKTIVEIAESLEKQGYDPITEISYDDRVWEVEAYKGETAYELSVDPKTGEIITEHRDHGDRKPPAGSKKLSELLRALVLKGCSRIDDVSFEWKNWEVEAVRERTKRELKVDPMTGEVISDRVDD